MVTADALVAHLVGDYILQSDYMATEKTKKSVAALAHVFMYTLPFLALTQSWKALLFIAGTHFIIDRWRLARYVCWLKNFLAPRWLSGPEPTVATFSTPIQRVHNLDNESTFVLRITSGQHAGEERKVTGASDMGRVLHLEPERFRNHPWSECEATGYHKDRPPFLSVWLLIIADNTLHILLNGVALTYPQ